jgi:hypothetical protein
LVVVAAVEAVASVEVVPMEGDMVAVEAAASAEAAGAVGVVGTGVATMVRIG